MADPVDPNAPDDSDPDNEALEGAFDKALNGAFEVAGDAAKCDVPAAGDSVLDHIAKSTGSRPWISLRADSDGGLPPQLEENSDSAGPTGKYVIQNELGRGGVGAVRRGHDNELGREVAMKFLHEKYKDFPEILHRFVEEAQIGGQLQHPGIVPVYDLGMSLDQSAPQVPEGRDFSLDTRRVENGTGRLPKMLVHGQSRRRREPLTLGLSRKRT